MDDTDSQNVAFKLTDVAKHLQVFLDKTAQSPYSLNLNRA